jgi:GNAT superfamily N-acetyltransferase
VTVLVRPASAADAAAIDEIRRRGWEAAYGALLSADAFADWDAAANTTRIVERLRAGSWRAVVAVEDDRVLGFASFGPCRDDGPSGAAELYGLYVDPDRTSGGIGSALLAAATAQLSRPVLLWVLEQNHGARRFYERAGWRPDGARKPARLLGGIEVPELRYRLDGG